MQLEKVFHYISNLLQSVKFTMEGENNEELAFLDTLLKRNNGKIFLLIYRKPTHTGQYLHYSSDQQIGCEESVFPVVQFSLFSITSKHDSSKQNTRIKGNN